MIDHNNYNAEIASLNIKRQFLSRLENEKTHELENIPNFKYLLRNQCNVFKATVICIRLEFLEDYNLDDKNYIYKILMSEIINAMGDDHDCIDYLIVGDFLFGVYYTPMKENMDNLIDNIGKINSTVDLFKQITNLTNIKILITAEYGLVRFIDLNSKNANSYSRTSNYQWFSNLFAVLIHRIKDISILSLNKRLENVYINKFIYDNLYPEYQKLFKVSHWFKEPIYVGNPINTQMSNWKGTGVINLSNWSGRHTKMPPVDTKRNW